MAGFNFEKNLPHQTLAVNSTIVVFKYLEREEPNGENKQSVNPNFEYKIGFQYYENLKNIQKINEIEEKLHPQSNIVDIMMETGTGKTYTCLLYTSPSPRD